MSSETFDRERLYQASAAIARNMLNRGLISGEEYCRIDTILLAKYKPILGSLQPLELSKNLDNKRL